MYTSITLKTTPEIIVPRILSNGFMICSSTVRLSHITLLRRQGHMITHCDSNENDSTNQIIILERFHTLSGFLRGDEPMLIDETERCEP